MTSLKCLSLRLPCRSLHSLNAFPSFSERCFSSLISVSSHPLPQTPFQATCLHPTRWELFCITSSVWILVHRNCAMPAIWGCDYHCGPQKSRDFGDKALQCHTAISGCDGKSLAHATSTCDFRTETFVLREFGGLCPTASSRWPLDLSCVKMYLLSCAHLCDVHCLLNVCDLLVLCTSKLYAERAAKRRDLNCWGTRSVSVFFVGLLLFGGGSRSGGWLWLPRGCGPPN